MKDPKEVQLELALGVTGNNGHSCPAGEPVVEKVKEEQRAPRVFDEGLTLNTEAVQGS